MAYGSVKYNNSQNLTTSQKAQARTNIGAVSSDEITGVVKYSESQTLTDEQKTQARTNIGAGTSSFDGKYTSLTEKPNAVLFDTQTLTSAQKTQARQNIGAGTSSFSGSYYDLTNKPTIDWNAKSGYGHIENRVCYEDITDNSADLPHFTTTEVATNSDGQRVYYAYYAECEKTILATHPSELYADGLSVFLPSYYVGWFSNSATVDVYGNPRLFKILTNTSVVSAYGTFIGNQNLDIDNGMDYCIAVVCIGSFWPCFAISTTKDVNFGKIYHRIIDLKQLDEKFIPDTIARITDIPEVPATSVAHQQLVTNADGNTVWTDRTHWKEESVKTLVDNITLDSTEDSNFTNPFELELKTGNAYTVVLDGVTYDCVAAEKTMYGETFVFIGNKSVVGEEIGTEPFAIICARGMVSVTLMESAVHTINITEKVVEYHALDPNYLPPIKVEHPRYSYDLEANDPKSLNYVKGRTHYVEYNLETLLEETKLVSERDTYNTNSKYVIPLTEVIDFPDPTIKYVVKYDGQEYCFEAS